MHSPKLDLLFAEWKNEPDNLQKLTKLWEELQHQALQIVRRLFGRQCHCGRTATDVLASVTHPPQWLRSFRGSSVGELMNYLRASIRNKILRLRSSKEAQAETFRIETFDRPERDMQEQTAQANELLTRLRSVVEALDEEDRLLWRMRFEEEASYEQIATWLGRTEASARQRYHRVVNHVRLRLGETT